MNNKFHLLYISIIVVLVALLLSSKRQIKVVENRVTDTIHSTRIDTITQYIPKYVYKHTIDTLYLPTNDQPVINLPIEQTHYASNGVYDVWISGYRANLDSIKTYQRIEYRTITNNVTKEIYKNTLDLYAYTGFRRFDHRVGQVIGLTIKTPKKWIISSEFGVMDNKIIYGMNLGFKLN